MHHYRNRRHAGQPNTHGNTSQRETQHPDPPSHASHIPSATASAVSAATTSTSAATTAATIVNAPARNQPGAATTHNHHHHMPSLAAVRRTLFTSASSSASSSRNNLAATATGSGGHNNSGVASSAASRETSVGSRHGSPRASPERQTGSGAVTPRTYYHRAGIAATGLLPPPVRPTMTAGGAHHHSSGSGGVGLVTPSPSSAASTSLSSTVVDAPLLHPQPPPSAAGVLDNAPASPPSYATFLRPRTHGDDLIERDDHGNPLLLSAATPLSRSARHSHGHAHHHHHHQLSPHHQQISLLFPGEDERLRATEDSDLENSFITELYKDYQQRYDVDPIELRAALQISMQDKYNSLREDAWVFEGETEIADENL